MTTPIPGPAAVAGLATIFGGAAKTVEGLIPGAEAANTLIDGVIATRRWLSDRHNWARIGWTVGGVFMVYMGAIMLAKPAISDAAAAAGEALKVLPAGKAIKAVT